MDEYRKHLKQGKRIRQVIIIIAVIVFVALGFLLSDRIVEFVSDPEEFKGWIQQSGMVGVLTFAGLNMIQVILAVIPGGPFTITAGYVFGPLKGTLLCIFAATIASTIVFVLVRKFGKRLVAVFVSEEHMQLLEEYERDEKNEKRIERLLIIIFVIPGTPKDPLTYLAGMTKIPVWKWFLVSLIGRFPGAYLSALGGNAFGSGKYAVIIAVVGGIVVLGIIGRIIKSMVEDIKSDEEE